VTCIIGYHRFVTSVEEL